MGLSKRLRFEILKRDGFRCRYCGATPVHCQLEVDHIVAVANGGSNDRENLATACDRCNNGKSDVPLEKRLPSPTHIAQRLQKHALVLAAHMNATVREVELSQWAFSEDRALRRGEAGFPFEGLIYDAIRDLCDSCSEEIAGALRITAAQELHGERAQYEFFIKTLQPMLVDVYGDDGLQHLLDHTVH